MNRRDWIIFLVSVALVTILSWQHERWHELNTRTAALKAETEVVSEMCQALTRAVRGNRP